MALGMILVLSSCLAGTTTSKVSGSAAYYEAVGLARQGKYAEAVKKLDELARKQPDDRFADDAVFRIAQICERNLLNMECALEKYKEILDKYEGSRLYIRAKKRYEYLQANRSSGDEVLLKFEKIIRSTPLSDKKLAEKGLSEMQALLRNHPDFPQKNRGEYWMAEALFHLQQEDEAIKAWQVMARHEGKWAERAKLRLGDLWMARQDFAKALYWYEALGEPVKSLASRARLFLWEKRTAYAGIIMYIALLVVLCLIVFRSGAARSCLWPAPAEFVLLLPVASILAFVAHSVSTRLWVPMAYILLGGMIALYMAGAAIRAKPRLGVAGLAGLSVMALAGCSGMVLFVLYHYRLLQSVIHTWIFGVD